MQAGAGAGRAGAGERVMGTRGRRGLGATRTVLGNGAVVLAARTSTTPVVTISATVDAGSVWDPVDVPGLSWFVSRVLDRGNGRRTADEMAAALDSRGVTLSVAATRHLMTIGCTALADDFEAMLELVGDVAMSPTFPPEEVEGRRAEIVTAIRQDEDNPAVTATEGLMSLLYPGGHPYGRLLKGRVDTVERIDRARLAAFHAARFSPASLVLVVAGDVAPGRVVDAADRVFGGWPARAAPPGPPLAGPPASARQRLVIPMMNKAQADIAYGLVAIARADPAYHAFSLLNNVLGQYALGGRLGDSIRERQGMAYYVFSALEANLAPGPLVIRAGVDPRHVDRAVASMDEELERMAREGVSERELAESKQYLIGSLPLTLETSAGIAGFLQVAEQFNLGMDYDSRLPDLLRRVTLDEVNGLASRVLRLDRAAVVIAGPYGGTQSGEASASGLAASQ